MEPEYNDLVQKYKDRIKKEFGEAPQEEPQVTSKEYSEFKQELYPTHLSVYEQACNFS